jgi:hypothetical protein
MPRKTTPKKGKQKKSGNSKFYNFISTTRGQVIVAMITTFAIAGIGYHYLHPSFALDPINTRSATTIVWSATQTVYPTRYVESTDGKLCVATRFNSKEKARYYFIAIPYGSYSMVAGSTGYDADGDRDHFCFDGGITKHSYYYVDFIRSTNGTITGPYTVTGYHRP